MVVSRGRHGSKEPPDAATASNLAGDCREQRGLGASASLDAKMCNGKAQAPEFGVMLPKPDGRTTSVLSCSVSCRDLPPLRVLAASANNTFRPGLQPPPRERFIGPYFASFAGPP